MRTEHVVALVSRIRESANALLVSELTRLGHPDLAPSHGAILGVLYDRGELPMGTLAQAIGRKKNTLTVLVRKLETAGYVQRDISPGDSRVSMIALTPKGEAFRKDFDAISRMLLSRVWGDMEQGQREALVRGLERILANLG